jgi:hypothetical protein
LSEVKSQKALLMAEKEKFVRIAEGLPFIHGWPWYKWAWNFIQSRNRINLLCAANQISKSSTQIRKCLMWATDTNLWTELWENSPTQFWYLYPSQKVVNAEFETKWKSFLPRGEFKNDPVYGWKEEKSQQNIVAIHFNSGVHVYFKTYMQSGSVLQSGSCDAIFCDEELPVELYHELIFRLTATNGYFHMVFTATLGQEFWRRALEPGAEEKEELPNAFKQVVSLFDSQYYMNGQASQWTDDRIRQVIANCSTDAEVQKRVYGKFIVVGGRKYEAFDIKRHLKPKHHLPKDWLIFAACDPGSGGEKGHPAAICFVGVRPDYRAGRVFLGWRGDKIQTTAGDVYLKYRELVKENNLVVMRKFYDWGSADFNAIAERNGDGFEKAEKSHEIGVPIVNSLFKHDALFIYDTPELLKLAGELSSLKSSTAKRKAKDDFCDALRYVVAKIPWDWSMLTGQVVVQDEEPEKPMNDMQRQIYERRKAFDDYEKSEKDRIDDEFSEWNDMYES